MWGTVYGLDLGNGTYRIFWSGIDMTTGRVRSGSGYSNGWPHKRNAPNDTDQPLFKFELLPADVLQVTASIDAKCDIYELGTGKLLLKDVDVVACNSYQSIPVKPSNTPYLIQFKVDGKVVSQQIFIFNNSNHLSVGGKNE